MSFKRRDRIYLALLFLLFVVFFAFLTLTSIDLF